MKNIVLSTLEISVETLKVEMKAANLLNMCVCVCVCVFNTSGILCSDKMSENLGVIIV